MKKWISFVLSVMLVCSTISLHVFADNSQNFEAFTCRPFAGMSGKNFRFVMPFNILPVQEAEAYEGGRPESVSGGEWCV